MRLVQTGEVRHFKTIVETYQKQIYVFCYRMLGSEHEAEDALQDIMVRAYEKINRYEPTSTFSSWLYKLAYHHCITLLRKRKVRDRIHRLFPSSGYAKSAEQIVNDRIFGEPLHSVLLTLSAEERSLLVLRVFQEKSFQEMASILGKGTEAVKKKYARLRRKLVVKMHEREEEQQCDNRRSSLTIKN